MGIKPKNHMKENLRDIRQTEERHRCEREEAARPQKELYKLDQFKHVDSKLYEKPEHQVSRRRPSLGNGEFLERGVSEKRREALALESRIRRDELDRKMEEAKYLAEKPPSPRKPTVPRSNETARLAPSSNTDFISRNKAKAVAMTGQGQGARRRGSEDEGPALHEEFGRVPEYLEARKAHWADEEEERRRRMPDPSCPPGMCVMPEAERTDTLETLQASKAEAMAQLRRMPFVVETPSQRKRQDMLEGKLREIDNAIAIFSKPKVYVAMR